MVRRVPCSGMAYLIDMRTEYNIDCPYALLEWRVAIPTCFQKNAMNLAKGLEAQVIPLLSPMDLDEGHSQVRSISPASEEVEGSMAGLPLLVSMMNSVSWLKV